MNMTTEDIEMLVDFIKEQIQCAEADGEPTSYLEEIQSFVESNFMEED